ncbi:MAG: hypothetical protein ABJA98_01655 [Acidobacteriota bacterium]
MGGRGSGGRRVGSGRKGKRSVVVRHPSAPVTAPIDTFDPPAELQGSTSELANLTSQLAFLQQAARPGDLNPQIAELQTRIDELEGRAHALAIWHELAPSAFAKRTLTPETAAAFVMLCRAVVQERALSASPAAAGGPNHRGLMHRVATWMKDFCLSPFGKPLSEAKPAAAVVSKWAGLLR